MISTTTLLLAIWFVIAGFSPPIQATRRADAVPKTTATIWPNGTRFELFLGLVSSETNENVTLRSVLLRTLLFFWPLAQTQIVGVADHTHADQISFTRAWLDSTSKLGRSSLNYLDMKGAEHMSAKLRRRWVILWADNFTTADYIGFVQPSTAMITVPICGDLFDGDKPVVITTLTTELSDKFEWYKSIAWALGRPATHECARSHLYTFKRRHLALMRDYVVQNCGSRSFEEFYRRFSTTSVSDYSLLCDYVWHFHKEEYAWHLQASSVSHNSRAQILQLLENNGMDGVSLMPRPRVAIDYEMARALRIPIVKILLFGFCFFDQHHTAQVRRCNDVWRNFHHVYSLQFIYSDIGAFVGKELHSAFSVRQEIIRRHNYTHAWNDKEIRRI